MIPELRDALTSHLLLLGVVEAYASYKTKIDVKTLDIPKVTVIPSARTETPLNRAGQTKYDVTTDLAYRARVTDTDNLTELDRHDARVEEILESLTVGDSIGDGWMIMSVTRPTLFSVEHIQEAGVFTSIIKVVCSKVI